MIKLRSCILFWFIIVTILSTMIAFLYPFFPSLFFNKSIDIFWEDNSFGIGMALYRTCLFAVLSSCINTLLGLQLALLFRHIPINSKIKTGVGSWLPVLLVPVVLGNVTISYVFKSSLYGSDLFDTIIRGGAPLQFIFLLIIQFWQYGFLFAYLFWISIRQIPQKRFDYATSVKMTEREIVRDVILPFIRGLFILLFLINLLFAFFESAKCQFVFKTSQGTGTEFISQALYRIYQSFSNVDPATSEVIALKNGFIITLCVLILAAICGSLIIATFSFCRKKTPFFFLCTKKNGEIIAKICIIIVLLPIVIAFFKSTYTTSIRIVSEMIVPLLLTLISALFATTLAVLFGVASRVVLNKELNKFSAKSLFFFLFIFLLQLVPPVCVVICGFHWMSIAGYNEITTYLIWIWGHPILIFPILGSFVVATHFIVDYNEIEWNIIHKMTNWDIIKYSFWMRFRKDYVLTFLFAFAFIWNDITLNKILSDEIPSFAEKMQRLFIGRATNDAQATLFALIALLLAFICISLWRNVMKRVDIENVEYD